MSDTENDNTSDSPPKARPPDTASPSPAEETVGGRGTAKRIGKMGNRCMVAVFVLAVIAFLAGIAIFPLLQNSMTQRPAMGANPDRGKLKSLERAMAGAVVDLESLRQRVNELQNQLRGELKQTQKTVTARAAGLSGRVDALRQDLRSLAEKLAALPTGPAAAIATATADRSVLLDRVSQLEALVKQTTGKLTEILADGGNGGGLRQLTGTLVSLKSQLQAQAQAASERAQVQQTEIAKSLMQNQSLRKKLAQLEAALATQSLRQRRDALGLALADLGRALAAGAKADAALAALQGAAKTDTELQANIAALKKLLRGPISTLTKLQRQFSDLARQALAAERAGNDGLWSSALKRLSGLISLRRTGEVPGGSVEAILARGESRLQQGNLAGAISQLAALKGPAVEVLGKWLAMAGRRVAAESEIAQLRSAIIATMAAAK